MQYPEKFSSESKSEKYNDNPYGELKLKKKGQLKHTWHICKSPKVQRFHTIQLKKIQPNLQRLIIPIFDRF
jgi:hypothetical protein